jgi:hypothetical protein
MSILKETLDQIGDACAETYIKNHLPLSEKEQELRKPAFPFIVDAMHDSVHKDPSPGKSRLVKVKKASNDMVKNETEAKNDIKDYEREAERTRKCVELTLAWAFDKSRGPLWVSAAGGTFNVLAGNLARFLGTEYIFTRQVLRSLAISMYGPDYYGILWIRNGIKDLDEPYRDAKGVKTYLERCEKRGEI